jgi:hypothetical protein
MASALLEALDAVAQLLATKEPRRSLEDGRFYLRFLGLETIQEDSGSVEAWRIVQERIATVFGPGLLDWTFTAADHHHAKRRQSVRMPKLFGNAFFAALSEDEETEEDLQESKFFALVALLTLYISAVHDQQESLWATLTSKLTGLQQARIQHAFQYLLDNRRSMTKDKLDGLISSFSPVNSTKSNVTTYSTPYRTTATSCSSLGESFTYSPSIATPPAAQSGSPLQDFLQTQQTRQIIEKLQRELRETRAELDQEKGEATYLRAEATNLNDEMEKLRHDLDSNRDKLFASNNGKESSVSMSEIEELRQRNFALQQKLADVKDSKKYLENIEAQLETTMNQHKELESRFDGQQQKLQEKTVATGNLERQLTQIQVILN